MPKFAVTILLIFISLSLKAQTWELGGAVGASGYMGDLNPTNPLKFSGVALGAYVQRNFDGYLSLKLNYTYGKIGAADSNSSNQQFRNRNLSFKTSLQELSLIGEFNFMEYIPDVSHSRYTPFIFLGLGVVDYNPQANYKGQTYNLRPLMTEGETPYSKTAFTIPYGAGIKYNFSGKWNVTADIGYRQAFTDYLDDVSGLYADPAKLPNAVSMALADRSGEKTGVYIGTPGTQRGDLRPHDTYLFLQVGVSFTFVTERCYFSR
jgi:opacity protein-like surface antigen